MIKSMPHSGAGGLTGPIDAIIEEYGARRVLAAALRALLRRKPSVPIPADELPDALRRDIGLPPIGPPPIHHYPRPW